MGDLQGASTAVIVYVYFIPFFFQNALKSVETLSLSVISNVCFAETCLSTPLPTSVTQPFKDLSTLIPRESAGHKNFEVYSHLNRIAIKCCKCSLILQDSARRPTLPRR